HPLVCTAFNADFDGDQMAVHLPLSNAAILEAQLLMLASHNILNPANGAPITVPSQDMVLGLYYMTKIKKSTADEKVKGEGMTFYSPEEVIIAYNEEKVELHTTIKVKVPVYTEEGIKQQLTETSVGRVLFNQIVPAEVGFINELLTKKNLREAINLVLKRAGISKTAIFLDEIKGLGFRMAFQGGLSFNMDDVIIPEEKEKLIAQAEEKIEEVMNNYNMGVITNNERYNQVIDIWTITNSRITDNLMRRLAADKQGFNSIFMMLDSGARGSKDQIRQLAGMRGLMGKPQKSGASGGEIIENPILSNFKEGLSILEYFISTHGARKGLADTALKTADAGYLTRRLVDVAQDAIINEEDCGTLRGLAETALKNTNDEVVESLYDRILGRVSVHDLIHPVTGKIIVRAGEEITELLAEEIADSPIEAVEIRSVLTCESKHGVCAKCYGRNLATGRMVQKGEAVGVIAAQSIGEPGTQLTLRTFHTGGVAAKSASESSIIAKFSGVIELEEVKTLPLDDELKNASIVIGRSGELRIIDPATNTPMMSHHIPYGSRLYVKNKSKVNSGDTLFEWDPYNALILTDLNGKIEYENIDEGYTFKEETDEQTGFKEKVIIDSRDKTRNPVIKIMSKDKEVIRAYNIPVGARIVVNKGDTVKAGDTLVKIPRATGKSGDITGGLPRVTELFEARNPSNPAVVSEIDGVVSYGGIKRGNREVIITPREGEVKKYLVPLSKHILAQDNDFVKAGQPLSDGIISPGDILAIKGPSVVQEYLVNEVQEVYRLQGVKINDKHFEVIVRQMMRKVIIEDPGDTRFLEKEQVSRIDFIEENDNIIDKKVVIEPGDSSQFKAGQIVSLRKLRDENSLLKRKDLKPVVARDAIPATSIPLLQGITQASLHTKSWISAASFQETTKVLNEAAVSGKVDYLLGLKENVIVGHQIPAGTGLREYERLIVGSQEEYDLLMASKRAQQAEPAS
ncbi:MAG: DNA-directed RNA polymerase subunit beta', partial [Bacteroidia bacterium]|nr:DNA-directed RNA polymerase subunit beta' [Bacteroidia bacterium]